MLVGIAGAVAAAPHVAMKFAAASPDDQTSAQLVALRAEADKEKRQGNSPQPDRPGAVGGGDHADGGDGIAGKAK